MKKPLPVRTYADHKNDWLGCTRCLLHEHRRRVVLCRGNLPCDVLFVGEAPGESEDTLGGPFLGPAGTLLDQIVERVMMVSTRSTCECGSVANHESWCPYGEPLNLRWAFTNLVGCIPHNESGDKYAVPKAAIKECRPRVIELCAIAKPKLLVHVGALAEKHWGPDDWEKYAPTLTRPAFVRIDHPAAILRAGRQDRTLMIQRCEAVLEDALQDVFGAAD